MNKNHTPLVFNEAYAKAINLEDVNPALLKDEFLDHFELGGQTYREAKVIEFDGKAYIVSKKAILTINLTPVCNAQCKFCYNGITFFINSEEDRRFDDGLSRAIKFASKAGIRNVSISGGEPTLRPERLLKVLDKIKGFFQGFVRVHTNGSQLLKTLPYEGANKTIAELIKDKGVTDVSISLAHYHHETNAMVMNLPNRYSSVSETVKELNRIGLKVRFSCFLHNEGINSKEEIAKYYAFSRDLGVCSFVFRISSGIPKESALNNEFTKGNESFLISTEEVKSLFESIGFTIKYQRQDIDYDLYILNKENIEVSVDRSSDVEDPDKKIRRLILMPQGSLYTSWVNSASFLFKSDLRNILDSQKRNMIGKYPAVASRRPSQTSESKIDLHLHSNVSDGILDASVVVQEAAKKGITHLVFTEHNSIHDNWENLVKYASDFNISIPFCGMEVSVNLSHPNLGKTFRQHLLVYGPVSKLRILKEQVAQANAAQNNHLIDQFNYAFGALESKGTIVDPDLKSNLLKIFDKVENDHPHLSSRKYLFTRSYLSSLLSRVFDLSSEEIKQQFFAPIDPKRKYAWALDAADIIRKSKALGLASVIAHPGWIRLMGSSSQELSEEDVSDYLELIIGLKSVGLNGIELKHRANDPRFQARLSNLALDLDLISTGGSDFHGKEKCSFGENLTSIESYERIRSIFS